MIDVSAYIGASLALNKSELLKLSSVQMDLTDKLSKDATPKGQLTVTFIFSPISCIFPYLSTCSFWLLVID